MNEVWQRLSAHKPPRNGNGRAQTVLLWGYGSYSLGQWDENFEQFDQIGRVQIDVTHWQKLPSRPSAQEQVEAQAEYDD